MKCEYKFVDGTFATSTSTSVADYAEMENEKKY